MVEPYDDRPYDPLAEAIGWLVRACAEVEFWLNVIAARARSASFPDAVWISSGEKARLLLEHDPDLDQFVKQIIEILEIRNTLAHGIARSVPDRSALELEVQPSTRNGAYRKLRLTRDELIELADLANDIANRLKIHSSENARTDS